MIRRSENLDSVVDELRPEEVRWFYKNEHEKRWLNFNDYDSIRIELKYRQIYQEWYFYKNENSWTNYLEMVSQENLDGGPHYKNYSSSGAENSEEKGINVPGDAKNKILVRSGIFEVDLLEWKCYSIYWPEDECGITRGIWFYDVSWQPLEEDLSDQVEMFHLEHFYGHKLSDYYVDPNSNISTSVLHTLTLSHFQVEWHSPTEIYLFSEAAASKLVRNFTQKLGLLSSASYRIHRGYKEQSIKMEPPTDIAHLVFVIHGVGQKANAGCIIRNTSCFRDCVTWLMLNYFPTMTQRAEFIPVEWRNALTLDGGIVEAITPQKVLRLRNLVNASALDVLYYSSSLYEGEIKRGLINKLSKLYTNFTERNPYFTANGGKVSVICHSLGNVIFYDITTGMRVDSWRMKFPQGAENSGISLDSTKPSATSAEEHSLPFQIENMFCLGSPLSMFLALRSHDSQSILPSSLCRRFYNIFHPSDPVAYRMEPLIHRNFCHIAPVEIQAYHSGTRRVYDSEPLILDTSCNFLPTSQTFNTESVSTSGSHTRGGSSAADVPTTSQSSDEDQRTSKRGLIHGSWRAHEDSGPIDIDSLSRELPHRLDFVLRQSSLGGSYLSVLTAHITYWSNYDVAYFVLTRLFPEETNAPRDTSTSRAHASNDLSHEQEVIDQINATTSTT